MNITIFRKAGMQAAMLALCTSALCTMPMIAQDTTPPAAPQGQTGRGPGGPRGNQVEMLTKKLNLTPDQVTQVKAIDDDSRTQAMAVRNDTSLSEADRRTKMMDIRKASQDKIRAVLTDDQKTKYDEMQAKAKERRQGGGAPPPPPPQ